MQNEMDMKNGGLNIPPFSLMSLKGIIIPE